MYAIYSWFIVQCPGRRRIHHVPAKREVTGYNNFASWIIIDMSSTMLMRLQELCKSCRRPVILFYFILLLMGERLCPFKAQCYQMVTFRMFSDRMSEIENGWLDLHGITLHYRTRCRQQLWEKWSAGEKVSLEAVPKNSERWRWCDDGWQTVPEAASSHRKRTIAESGQPCASDH